MAITYGYLSVKSWKQHYLTQNEMVILIMKYITNNKG